MSPNSFNETVSLSLSLFLLVVVWGIISAIGNRLIRAIELTGRVFRIIPYMIYKRLLQVSTEERANFHPTRLLVDIFGAVLFNLDDMLYRIAISLEKMYISILESFFSPQESEVMAKVNQISMGNNLVKDMLSIDDFRKKRNEYYYQLRSHKFLLAFLELISLTLFVFGSISSLKVFFDPALIIPSFVFENDVYVKILSIIGPFILWGFWLYSSPKKESSFLEWMIFMLILFAGIINLFSFLLYRYIVSSTSSLWNFVLETNLFLAPLIMILIASMLARGVLGVLSVLVIGLYIIKIVVLFIKVCLSLIGVVIKTVLEAVDKFSGLVLFGVIPILSFIVDSLINHAFVLLGQIVVMLLLVPNKLLRTKILSIEPVEGFDSVAMPDFVTM